MGIYFPVLMYIRHTYACRMYVYLILSSPHCMHGLCKNVNHCNQMLNYDSWISDPIGAMSHMRSSPEKPAIVPCHNIRWNCNSGLFIQRLANGEKHISSHTREKKTLVTCSKAVEAIGTTNSDGGFY